MLKHTCLFSGVKEFDPEAHNIYKSWLLLYIFKNHNIKKKSMYFQQIVKQYIYIYIYIQLFLLPTPVGHSCLCGVESHANEIITPVRQEIGQDKFN